MKVWNIVSGTKSGALNIALIVGEHLKARGHEVQLVLRKYNKTDRSDADVVGDCFVLDYVKALACQIRARRPDLILVHGYSTHIWTKLAVALSRVPVRLIHIEHNVERYTWLRSWLTRKLDVYTERYICVSQGVARRLLAQKVAAEKVSVIYNGIHTELFHRAKEKQAVYTIGMTARFSRQKDQMTLIKAVAYLIKEKKCELHLFLLGDGKTKERCERYVKEAGLDRFISFESGSFAALAPRLDLFVLSTHYEGLPLVLCEAMAARIPVLASDVAGVDEIVLDHKTGLLFPEGNVKDLAQKILFCMQWQGTPELEALLDAAEDSLEEIFSLEKMCETYQLLVEKQFGRLK